MTNIRHMADRDIGEVVALMRLSLGETQLLRRTPELFRWKHIDNPFGRSIALVAEEAGVIVGLRTFMRWSLVTPAGEQLRCIRAVDTATHPAYQRRGIFKRLTEEAVEIAREEGVDMIFNTPNAKSKPGYLKMGWQEVGRIGAMVRPSVWLGRPDDLASEIDPTHYLYSPRPANGIVMKDRAPRGLRTLRNPEYVKWRFTSHPTARYFAASVENGTAILRPHRRHGRRELVLADVFGRGSDAIRAAIRATKQAYLATWFSAGSLERAQAIRRGFLPLPGVSALTLVARPLVDLPTAFTSISGWDVAVSDFELL